MANLDSLIRFFDLSILIFEVCELVHTGWIEMRSRSSLATICNIFRIAIAEDEMKCSREYWICLNLNILVVCNF